MSWELILWWLIIYAILGWCLEVIYATTSRGVFVNRGFLSGPYCPIYGFGALLVLWLTAPFRDSLLGLFVVATILCSVLELLTGWMMSRFFKRRWWDYSGYPFNIGGYVCLQFALLWGLACVVMIRIIQPLLIQIAPHLISRVGFACLGLMLVAMLADLIATIKRMLKLKQQLVVIDQIDQQMRRVSDDLGEKIHDVSKTAMLELSELKQKHDELLYNLNHRYDRLIKAFPDFQIKNLLAKMGEAKLEKKLLNLKIKVPNKNRPPELSGGNFDSKRW